MLHSFDTTVFKNNTVFLKDMAPYPEEIDVFSTPHSRMKQLVDVYSQKVQNIFVFITIMSQYKHKSFLLSS